ncbi:MAG: GNAT family N-acetyltransferase [Promethearchaeota archaeon]
MVIRVPNSQFNSVCYIFDEHQHLRNLIEAIPALPRGELWIDSSDNPSVALFKLPGIHFLGGTPNSNEIEKILDKIPSKQAIFIPTQEKWITILKRYFKDKLRSFDRFALSASSLTINHIHNLRKELPYGYHIKQIDHIDWNQIRTSIGHYIHIFFRDIEHFKTSGKGYCVRNDNRVISMASSLVPVTRSLEIQVDTVESTKYLRKGFATRAVVELIEYCLKKGIDPHWDADTEISKKFAQKLGYSNPQPYKCYYWVKKNEKG